MTILIFILFAIILIVLSVMATVMISRYLSEKEARRLAVEAKRNRAKNSIRDRALYDVEINRLIFKLKSDLKADKVSVCRFHNGGTFNNGWDMKKFSCTHETPGGSIKPLHDTAQGILNSRYSEAILSLVTLDTYSVEDRRDCIDPNFKADMEKLGHESTHLFLIRQFDGRDEGFICIAYNRTFVMDEEKREIVKNEIPRILGLVNMREEALNNS
jgi:hypothetical protein